ncbi:tripartite tricarboxylate transporter substrate binding protein [Cupriavidus basilensis]|uniref:Tripartite tricarboxylate transporter substrate binding protein n=1 Tax=Cupriavidus basilensis TaxID=68895 RepID=A0ABT6AG29_9BURK|nr:tripartite tricarboxylate transporter substrate binding protein [Cupriavidus basilensis]MDF3831557.1 tripartite tricarboxylate transporter substrate binding protein [Cupriavidus basilensis]
MMVEPTRRKALLRLGTLAVAATVIVPGQVPAAPAPWPGKPVRLVVPFSAGGPGDTVARLIAQALAKQFGQSVIVDNKPGAGGLIGSEYVAKSQADGYTLLVAGNGAIANGLLRTKMPYAEDDLVPVAITNSAPSVLITAPTAPFTDLKSLQAYGKAKGRVTFGTAGAGSTGHFVAEMVGKTLGVPVTVIHYKSGGESLSAVIGGQIDLASEAPVGVMGYVRGGRVRALAVTEDKRSISLPEVLTTTEQGFGGIRMRHWGGIYAPKGTPAPVIQRIATATHAALQNDGELRMQLEKNGYQPESGTPADFARFIESEKTRLSKIVRDSHMTLD